MRLPRAIYLLPPQGKSFLICPKHFSFVTSAASLTLWNVCGLQVWIASEECKWMLCVAQPHCQAAASLSNLTRAKNLWLLYTPSFLPLSFYLIVHIGHSNHYQTSSTLLQHFSPASFCSLSSGFVSFLFPFSRFSFSVSREGNCAAVVACSLCLSFVYCLMPLMSCQSQGYSINWLSSFPLSSPPSGGVTGDLLQPLALKSNFISRQKFWLLVLLCSSLIPFAFSSSILLSLFAAIDNCATRTVDIPGKSTTATTTQGQLVINHFGSATVCVCVQLCVCVCRQRKLTKNINYVHEGRNLMRCRCRTEIEAALLFLQSAAAETREKKNTERKAQEKQKGSTEKTKTISFMPAPFLPGNWSNYSFRLPNQAKPNSFSLSFPFLPA